jgi:flagellar assembly protein FliH
MANIEKFLFDVSFDEFDSVPSKPKREEKQEQPVEEAEPEVPKVTLTEEELASRIAAAEAAAFERGMLQAETAAKDSADDEIARHLASISGMLPEFASRFGQSAEMRSGDAVIVAAAIARKLLPESMADAAMEEIEQLVREAVATLIDEPRIIIRCNPQIAGDLRERLDPIAAESGFEGRMIVVDTPSMAEGDCQMEWSDGGAQRDTGRLLEELDDRIDRYRKAQDEKRKAEEEAERQEAEAEPVEAEVEDGEVNAVTDETGDETVEETALEEPAETV